MKYLMITLLALISACSKKDAPPSNNRPPTIPLYAHPDYDEEKERITGLIGNKRFKVVSIIDTTTKENADTMYQNYIGSIYNIPTSGDTMTIENDSLGAFKAINWSLTAYTSAFFGKKAKAFIFPTFDRYDHRWVQRNFKFGCYNISENNNITTITLIDTYISVSYSIVLSSVN